MPARFWIRIRPMLNKQMMTQYVENGIDHRKAKIAFLFSVQIAAQMNPIAPSAFF